MKRRKKRNIRAFQNFSRKLVGVFVVMLMIISLFPNNYLYAQEKVETNKELVSEEQTAKQDEPVIREKLVYDENSDILKWQLEGLLVQTKDTVSEMIQVKEGHLDASKKDLTQADKLQLLLSFAVETIDDETYIVQGDQVSIQLPENLSVKKITKPQPLYAYEKSRYTEKGFDETKKQEQLGEYTIDEQHILHITFLKTITKEDKNAVFALLPIDLALAQSASIISMQLQSKDTLEIHFPAYADASHKQDPSNPSNNKQNNDKSPTQETMEEHKEQANSIEAAGSENVDNDKKDTSKTNPLQIQKEQKDKLTTHAPAYHRMTLLSERVVERVKQTLATSPYRITIQDGLPDGFEQVKINILNKNGGYSADDDDRTVGFKFEVSLQDDTLITALERVLTTLPNAPVFHGDYEQYDKDMLAFLNREDVKKALAKLEYTYPLGDCFNDANVAIKELYDDLGDKIGEYWVSEGVVHVVFTYDMYYYSNVSAVCNFDIPLDEDVALDDTPQDVEFENGKLIMKQIGTINDGDDSENAANYSIDKDAPLKVSGTEISYTITIKALTAKKTLEKTWFVDRIPAGLKVKQLFLVNGNEETPITKYTLKDGNLSYQITKENSKEIAFRLVLEADDETYQKLIKAGSMDTPFTNQAFLKDEKQAENLAESNEVATQMKVTFLKKEGKQQDLEGTKFNWTIQAATKLPYFKEGYLVDTFSYSDHMLAKGSSLNITSKGKTITYPVDEIAIKTANIPYEELTVENINEIGEGTKEPFYYLYETKEASPFEDETYQKQCVLLIPFDDYHGIKESEQVKIQYITELNRHGLSIEDYITNHHDDNKQIGNKVNLLWNNQGGTGPNPATWEDVVNFSKDVDTNVDVMDKKGTYYDPATQMAYWDLEINRMGAVIQPAQGKTQITVADIFSKGAYDLHSFHISYTEYHRDDASSQTQEVKDFVIADKDADKKQLILTMPAFDTNTYRIYHIQAKLKDPTSLSQQGDVTISNSAVMDAQVNGKPTDVTISADMHIKNTLIIKEPVNGYDYKAHAFTWKVIVNPNKLDIKDASVKDILEKHTKFGKLVSALDQDGNDVSDKITSQSTTEVLDGETRTIETFTLADIAEKSYTLVYTTILEDTNVLTNVTDSKVFNNKVILSGDVIGSEDVSAPIVNATDTAKIKVKNNQMEKGGIYDPEDGSITWTIIINKDQVNLKNLIFVENLREQLAEDEPSIQTLDQDSLHIYEVGIKEDGSISPEENEVTQDKVNDLTINGYDGFTWKFPIDDTSTYKLTFKTYLNEYAAGATIANEVYLKNPDGDPVEDSNISDGGYDGSFDFNDNATKNPRPKLAIRKISTNSIDPGENKNHLLDDAEFEINAYAVAKEADVYVLGDAIESYKKINVSTDGMAYFLNVMNKENVIYMLRETASPKGYKAIAEPQFFRFVVKDAPDKDSVDKVSYQGKEYPISPILYGANTPVPQIIIEDEPNDDAVFSFTKKIPALVKDGKVSEYQNAGKGITFRLHAIHQLEGKVKDRYVKTDDDGKVTIENLDAGEYTLTEIATDTNLDVGGSLQVNVTIQADGTYAFAFSGAANHGLSYQDNHTLYNDYVKGSFTFKKYAAYQNGEQQQIVKDNKEPLEGVHFTLKATGTTPTNQGYTSNAVSLSDGSVTFANLPVGEYELQEEKKDGYEQNSITYKVTISEEEGDQLVIDEDGKVYKSKKAKSVISPELHDRVLTNTPEKGSVILHKVIDSQKSGLLGLNGKPLQQVSFGLYRKIGNTIAEKPLYLSESKSDGSVVFKDVEYGDYVCKELSDLPQFNKVDDITILRSSFLYDKEHATFTYKQDVANALYSKTLHVHKQDQDGNALADVSFTLYRRAVMPLEEDSEEVSLLQPDATITSYYPYMKKVMTTNADGNFTLYELPVGDYLLIENGDLQDLQDGHNKVAVYMHIEKTKVEAYYHDNFVQELIDHAYNLKAEDVTLANGWKELPEKDGSYTVINQRKFAYVQVQKQTGEWQENNFVKPSYSKPLEGCVFQVNKVVEQKEVPYLRLTTNAQGMFPISEDGKLIGKDENNKEVRKHLYYGRYTIEEIATVTGYQMMNGKVSFDINDEKTTASHGGTVYICNEGAEQGYSIVGESANQKALINTYVRQAITLQKKGIADRSLQDAVFAIKDQDTIVAYVKAEKDSYTLSDTYQDHVVQATKDGIPYLYKDGDVFKLLAGNYSMEEIVVPKGYRKASLEVTISNTGKVSFHDVQNCRMEGNTLYDLPIALAIDKYDTQGKLLTGAKFVVKGVFADHTTEKTLEDANQAQLLPNTEYQLIESKAPDGYRCTKKQPIIQFDVNGKVEVIKDEGIVHAEANRLQFQDDAIRIQVVKKEKGKDTGLADAYFTLKGTFAHTTKTEITDLKTDKQGKLALYDTNWNLIGGHSYELIETTAPQGYALPSQSIHFTVDAYGYVTETKEQEEIVVENIPIQVTLKKIDATSKQPINASFILLDKTAATSQNIQTQNGTIVLTKLLQEHEYEVIETAVDQGYLLPAEKVASFLVNTDGSLTMRKGQLHDKTIEIMNERIAGKLQLSKLDDKTKQPLQNAEFTLYGEGYEKPFTTDDMGRIQVSDLPWGEYTLKETRAPHGYKLNPKEYHFTIDAQHLSIAYVQAGAITNTVNTFTIQKTDLKGNPLSQAIFTIEDLSDPSNNEVLAKALAQKTGDRLSIEGLLIANHRYELNEQQAPIGYQREKTKVQFTMQNDGTIKADGEWDAHYQILENREGIHLMNAPIVADMQKIAEQQPQENVIFTLTPKKDAIFKDGTTKPKTYHTDETGTIAFGKDVLQGNAYLLHEEKALNGFTYAKDVELRIDADGMTLWDNERKAKCVIKDEAMAFRIIKTDDQKKEIANKLFTLRQLDSEASWSLLSDEQGVLIERNSKQPVAAIVAADASYTLKEESMDHSSYLDLHDEIRFTITRDGLFHDVHYDEKDVITVSADGKMLQVENNRTNLSIQKTDMQKNPLIGAELAIFADVDGAMGKTIVMVEGKALTWTSDGKPHEIRGLPVGCYWLKELTPPSGYTTADPISFMLDAQGAVTILSDHSKAEGNLITMQDTAIMGQFKIHKTSLQKEDIANVQFDLYKKDGTKIAEHLTTDIHGLWESQQADIQRLDSTAKLSDGLAAGDYYLVETQTADEYQLPFDEEAKTHFTIQGKIEEEIVMQPDVLTIDIHNTSYQRSITIVKKDREDETAITDTRFSLQRVKDGTGNVVEEPSVEKTTLEDGSLQFIVNQKGTYLLRETQPAIGYVIEETPYEATFVVDDESEAQITLKNGNTVKNQRQLGTMQLMKSDALSLEALDGAVFALYQKGQTYGEFTTGNEYSKDAQGKYQAKRTDTGCLTIHDLPWGDYRIAEVKAPAGYQLKQREAFFTIGKKGSEMLLEVKGLAITNLKTNVTFHKLASYVESCSDETLGTNALPQDAKKALAGAEFSAYDEQGVLVKKAVSDATGTVVFEKLLADHTYTIKETNVPKGFVDPADTYQIHLDASGQPQDMINLTTKQVVKDIVNDVYRKDIVLKKVSENDPTKVLPNAVYGLYRIASIEDEHPQLIATAKTDAQGMLRFEGVLLNQLYQIQEINAPAGSYCAKYPITFQYIMKDNQIMMDMLDDGQGSVKLDPTGTIIWYEADVIVNVHKVDADGKALSNATLAIVDKDGKVLERWISDGKAHTIVNTLTAGETYRLKEIKAPYGYQLGKDIFFTITDKKVGVKENDTQEVTMQNTLTSLTIEKRDKDSKQLLSGAVFAIYDAATMKLAKDYQGNALTWTSQGRDKCIGIAEGNYILREINAPKGYQTAKDLPFTLQKDGTLLVDGNRVDQLIVMDERKVDTMIQPDPEEVKTFDTSHVYGYMGICIMTMLALGILSKKRRHNV